MRNNALTICCGVCVAGAFGVFTRWMQDLTAFDEHGLYVRGNIWGAVLLLLCIAAAVVLLFVTAWAAKGFFAAKSAYGAALRPGSSAAGKKAAELREYDELIASVIDDLRAEKK